MRLDTFYIVGSGLWMLVDYIENIIFVKVLVRLVFPEK